MGVLKDGDAGKQQLACQQATAQLDSLCMPHPVHTFCLAASDGSSQLDPAGNCIA
jgi:hypothetical protein